MIDRILVRKVRTVDHHSAFGVSAQDEPLVGTCGGLARLRDVWVSDGRERVPFERTMRSASVCAPSATVTTYSTLAEMAVSLRYEGNAVTLLTVVCRIHDDVRSVLNIRKKECKYAQSKPTAANLRRR